jgi:hypothetical protein
MRRSGRRMDCEGKMAGILRADVFGSLGDDEMR